MRTRLSATLALTLVVGCSAGGEPVNRTTETNGGQVGSVFRVVGNVDGTPVEFESSEFEISIGTRWDDFLGLAVSSGSEGFRAIFPEAADRPEWRLLVYFGDGDREVAAGDIVPQEVWFVGVQGSYELSPESQFSVVSVDADRLVAEGEFAIRRAQPGYCSPGWPPDECRPPMTDAVGQLKFSISGAYVERIMADCGSPLDCLPNEVCAPLDPAVSGSGGLCQRSCSTDEDCREGIECVSTLRGDFVCEGPPDGHPGTICDEAMRVTAEVCGEIEGFVFDPACTQESLAIAGCALIHTEEFCDFFIGVPADTELNRCIDEALGIERPSPLEAWDRLQGAICERVVACGPLGAESDFACHSGLRETITTPERRSSLSEDGRLANTGCLDSLPVTPCFMYDVVGDCFSSIVHGLDGQGAPCDDDVDCSLDGYCEVADSCPGVCTQRRSVGAACDRARQCFHRCISGVCRFENPGDVCTSRADCSFAYGCSDGRCLTREEGEPCTLSDECSPPFFCVEGQCADGVAPGGTCDDAHPCGYDTSRGLRLGRCLQGTCELGAGPGQPCVDDGQCPPFFRCDGTCEPLPDVGEPCVDACARGACDAGTCRSRAQGESCLADPIGYGECEGGYCDQVCLGDLPTEGACTRNEQCGPFAWCVGGGCLSSRVCQ